MQDRFGLSDSAFGLDSSTWNVLDSTSVSLVLSLSYTPVTLCSLAQELIPLQEQDSNWNILLLCILPIFLFLALYSFALVHRVISGV